MTAMPNLRVLFFDVFGTCVNQRDSVAEELQAAAQEALNSSSSIGSEVRAKAAEMTYEQWDEIGAAWNTNENEFVRESKERGNVDWVAVDKHRIAALPKLLAQRGLVILREDANDSETRVEKGSLWNASQLQHLATVWHRLTPWPDTCRGLDLLNKKFSTVALSNTYNELLQKLVAHGSIPFREKYSSDIFDSFKPNPKVYLGAAEKMGVKPEECALVAAHLFDLKGAKECGFYTMYVERPQEEKSPELVGEFIPDLQIKADEEGLIALAKRLGIS